MTSWVVKNTPEIIATLVSLFSLGLAVTLLAGLPLLMSPATRNLGGRVILAGSYVLGFLTWLFACDAVIFYLGLLGLLVGCALFAIGVIPLAMFGAIRHSDWSVLARLVAGPVLCFGLRLVGVAVGESKPRAEPFQRAGGLKTWLRWILVPVAAVAAGILPVVAVDWISNGLAAGVPFPKWVARSGTIATFFLAPFWSVFVGGKTAPSHTSAVAIIISTVILFSGIIFFPLSTKPLQLAVCWLVALGGCIAAFNAVVRAT